MSLEMNIANLIKKDVQESLKNYGKEHLVYYYPNHNKISRFSEKMAKQIENFSFNLFEELKEQNQKFLF